MALSRITALFPDVDRSPVTTVEDEPGWLYAQTCEAWWRGSPDQKVGLVLVYRSPLVTDTSRLYRPIADKLLAANKIEVVASGTQFDEKMMGEKGMWFYARTTQADALPEPRLPKTEIQETIAKAMSCVLGEVLATA